MKLPRIPLEVMLLAAAVVIIVGALPLIGLVKYTTSTGSFCMSCHSQGVAEVQARSNFHPGSVGCTSCHSKEKGIIPQGYPQGFSADEEVVNKNCLSCHNMIPKVKLTRFQANGVIVKMPHEFHVGTVGATCTTCHRNIAHDKTQNPSNRPSMTTCWQCHEQAKTACTNCHEGMAAASS